MPRNTLMKRLRGLWRFVRNPIDRLEWAWLRYPWFGEERDTPLPVVIAQLRAALISYWNTRDKVSKLESNIHHIKGRLGDLERGERFHNRMTELENRVTDLEMARGYPEEEGR